MAEDESERPAVTCDHPRVDDFEMAAGINAHLTTRAAVIVSGPVCESIGKGFAAGTSFVNAGILFHLYLTDTPVPVLGPDYVIEPQTNGLRSMAHFVFFVIFFYFGFIRTEEKIGAWAFAVDPQDQEHRQKCW